jgi:hypothetical protein
VNLTKLPPLDHLLAMTDGTGVIQHATETIPNRSTGYCTDDVARAFIVALMRLTLDPRDEAAARLAGTCLSFLHDAQLEDGRFHNFMAFDRTWLDEVGTHDSVGRALWALGYGMRHAPTEGWRRLCRTMFERGMGILDWLHYSRSQAYAMLGLVHAHATLREPAYAAAIRYLGGELAARFEAREDGAWAWFEDEMTYDNARLPEALIRAGHELNDARFGDVGLVTLAFYQGVTIENGIFVPIGNRGWYKKGGVRARYCQQPLEAVSLVDAELAALDATGDAAHLAIAETGLAWYYGKNTLSATLALPNGGCADGLEEEGVSRNAGAESTLALLAAAYAVAERRPRSLRVVR